MILSATDPKYNKLCSFSYVPNIFNQLTSTTADKYEVYPKVSGLAAWSENCK
jgi:hypothetical protein